MKAVEKRHREDFRRFGFGRVSSSDFSSHRQQTPEHGENISPHLDLAVSLVAPRYRYFCNRKSLFVGLCYKLGIERKTITVELRAHPINCAETPCIRTEGRARVSEGVRVLGPRTLTLRSVLRAAGAEE